MSEPIMLGTWEARQAVLSSSHAGSQDWVELAAQRGHSAASGDAVEGRVGIIAGPGTAYCVDLRSTRSVGRGLRAYTAERMCHSTSIMGPCATVSAGLLVIGESEAVVLPWARDAVPPTPSPTPRTFDGHSVVSHRGDTYVFDGASASLWRVTVSADSSLCFESIPASGDAPSRRRNQAAAAVAGYLFVHGGAGSDADMYAFDLSTRVWRCLQTGGTDAQPPGLEGHSLTVVGRRLVIFGGFVGKDTWNANTELYVATLETGGAVDWSMGRGRNPDDESKPSPRAYHAAATVLTPSGLALAVVGGVNQSNEAIVHSPMHLLRFKDALAAETVDDWKLSDLHVKRLAAFCDCILS